MECRIKYRGREITDADIVFIQELIDAHPKASRRQLSKLLCEAWNWRQENGALKDMVCRGLMLELHRKDHIELPEVRHRPPNPLASPLAERTPPPSDFLINTRPLQAGLSELQPLTFQLVRRLVLEPLFNHLIDRHHYLGYTQPVGEHLKYLVLTRGRPIACLAFCSAPRHLGPRDRFIGWSKEARRKNIRFIAYNTRFLILPWVRVPYLASHILSRMAKILPDDWQRVYKHPVWYLETFVDPERFKGTCYRAANWIYLGQTTGRGKDDQTKKPNRSLKDILGYPLCKGFRELLARVE